VKEVSIEKSQSLIEKEFTFYLKRDWTKKSLIIQVQENSGTNSKVFL